MHSCIYQGTVSHRRRVPVEHSFQYRLYMVYLDLDELPELAGRRGLIGSSKYSLRSFLRSDHLTTQQVSLADEVRTLIRKHTQVESIGPIRLLTQLRYLGYYMSPLNLYYCFDADGQAVQTVIAEVNNTPWNERHCYVLWDGNRTHDADQLEFEHPKNFHVSPFMDMDMGYRWRLAAPADHVKIHVANTRNSQVEFEAAMSLKRLTLDRYNLNRMSLRYPWMTAKIGAAIYLQALQLWWKKCPSYTHPKKHSRSTPTISEAHSQPLPSTNHKPAQS